MNIIKLQRFYQPFLSIISHSLSPAVLVEQFFMDNKKDLAYLISDEGKRNLIGVIVGGVVMFSI